MGRLNVPVEFEGTEEEARANKESHHFYYDPDGDCRCTMCDCRPSHAAAKYPCGASVPRRIIEVPQR